METQRAAHPGPHELHITEDFTRVARGYDLLCALNPGYLQHLQLSASRMGLAGGARVLDLCCGTGLSTSALRTACPRATITGLDGSSGMLEMARNKKDLAGVTWLEGDAMDPASYGAAGPYDGVFMAYGIRNVADAGLCLERLYRILSPGGVLCLHEYSVRDSRRSRFVWRTVTATIIIPLGWLVTRTTSIFRYLRRSVLDFDGVRALESRLRRAGFVDVRVEPMGGWQRGIVHSFIARRPR